LIYGELAFVWPVRHNTAMRKRSSKKSVENELAVPAEPVPEPSPPAKNPAAVALGKLGGAKGGAARAKKLTAEQRSAIAKKGADARWKKR